jgi:hypothetical protein
MEPPALPLMPGFVLETVNLLALSYQLSAVGYQLGTWIMA